jgi:hypothetical protein
MAAAGVTSAVAAINPIKNLRMRAAPSLVGRQQAAVHARFVPDRGCPAAEPDGKDAASLRQ